MTVMWWAITANWLVVVMFVIAICRAAASGEVVLAGGEVVLASG